MKVLSLIALVLILVSTGCKRCYECSYLQSTFLCVKNGDTLERIAYLNAIQDTYNLYTGMGYACDTDMNWNNTAVDNPVCGKSDYSKLVGLGYRCIDENEE